MKELSSILQWNADRVCAAVDFSPLQGKDILVTGASGLIGATLVTSLFEVVPPERLHLVCHSGPKPYLPGLFDAATVHQGDLTSPTFLASLPTADLIIHAACYGRPGRFLAEPLRTIALNTHATAELLQKVLPNGRFLFLSSSEVYSGCQTLPHNEEYIGTTSPQHPRSCYIEGKRCGEAICHSSRDKGIHASAARVSLSYGPGVGMHDERVLNCFMRKALSGKIDLLDQGKAVRTYCYVSDTVEMLLWILLHGRHEVYNVGGTSRTTIAELASSVASIANVSVEFPKTEESLEGAPNEVALDLTRISTESGKRHFVSLDEGLERTYQWHRLLKQMGV